MRWPSATASPWSSSARPIMGRRAASFRDLVADCDERIQVVVRFLALLELYRDGRVELHQGDTFGQIRVEWQG